MHKLMSMEDFFVVALSAIMGINRRVERPDPDELPDPGELSSQLLATYDLDLALQQDLMFEGAIRVIEMLLEVEKVERRRDKMANDP